MTLNVLLGQKDDSLYGMLLMMGYLFFDGFTSTFQEKLFKVNHFFLSVSQFYFLLLIDLSSISKLILCFLEYMNI